MRPKLSETLYAKYIKEREGGFLLENEFGFISYKFVDQECFIMNMYIEQSEQAKGHGRALIAKLNKIAGDADCNVISANVHLWDEHSSETLAAALATGFKVTAANNNVLVIAFKVTGGV